MAIEWWEDFDHERHEQRRERQRERERRKEREESLVPMIADIVSQERIIRAALVDTSELSAADFNDLKGRSLAMATAFGALHDELDAMQ